MEKTPCTTFAQYYANCDPNYVERMMLITSWVKQLVPEVKEKISWGMPTFDYYGNLLHFAQCSGYIGLYPGDQAIVQFQDRLTTYKCTKGSIHLPMKQELDEALLKEIILYSKEENEQIYKLRMSKKKSG